MDVGLALISDLFQLTVRGVRLDHKVNELQGKLNMRMLRSKGATDLAGR